MKTNRSSTHFKDREFFVRLPQAPESTSPVPWLTSIHATEKSCPYGEGRYRGNFSGLLIRDLLLYYRPRLVLDPMSGGGTCCDVCVKLDIRTVSFDLQNGFDATDSTTYENLTQFDFIWLHPPYWKTIRYSDNPRCLSNAATVDEFVAMLRLVLRNCARVLARHGRLAVLLGDGKHNGEYWGLPFRAFAAAEAEGYRLAAPEIIRFGHGSTPHRKEYLHSFIPRLHDICLVLQRSNPKKQV
jgi:hypothetical protein